MQGHVYIRDGHVFQSEEGDEDVRAYHELGGHHSGPYCLVCDQYFCEHCNPEIFNQVCPERLETLPGLEHPQPHIKKIIGRRIIL